MNMSESFSYQTVVKEQKNSCSINLNNLHS